MSKKISIYFLLVLVVVPSLVFGQKPEIRTSITPAEILIGEQAVLRLDVSYNGSENPIVAFPKEFEHGKFELLNIIRNDTTLLNDRKRIEQEFLITSFDSGLYSIDLGIVIGGDTFPAPSVGIKVHTMPIDTVNLEIADIKTVIAPAFVWADYHYWVLFGFGVFALLWVVLYLIQEQKRKKKNAGVRIEPKVVIAPHEAALEQLEQIKKDRVWTHGNDKLYFTQLTDVVRIYIESQFGVNALEMTSAELLNELRTQVAFHSVKREVESLFVLSDMVKFAKYCPILSESEDALVHAFLIVKNTSNEQVSEESKNELK